MAAGRGQAKVYIGADMRGFERGLDKGSKKMKQFGNDGQRMGKTFGGVSKKLLGVAGGIASVGAASAGIKDAVKSTETLAKGTASLARLTGQSTKEASRWVEVAKVRNVESKALNMGFISLAKNMKAATDGGEAQQKMFKDLGVSQKTLESGKTGDVLAELADTFERMPPGAEKAATAQKLFGRQAQTLLPLLDGGSKALREQLALSDKYGTTLSKNQVKSALDAVAAQRELTMAMDGVKIAVATKVLPWVVKGGRALADMIAQVRQGKGVFGTFARGVSTVAAGIAGSFNRLPDVFKKVLAGAGLLGAAFLAGGPVGLAVAAVAAGAGLIVTNWDKIKPVFERVRGAVGSAVEQIRPHIKSLIDAVVGAVPALQNVGRAFQWVFEKIWLPVAKRALPGVIQAVQGALKVITGIINVFSGVLTGDWSKAWKGVKQIVTGALKLVGGVIRAATAPFRAAMEIVWKGVKAVVSVAWNGIKSLVSSAVKGVVERVKNATAPARAAAGLVVKAFGAGFRAAKGAVMGPVKDAIGGAISWIGGKAGAFAGAGGKLVSAIVGAFKGLGKKIVGAFGNIAGLAKDVGRSIANWLNDNTPFGNKITIPGPLPDFTLPRLRGGGLAQGMAVAGMIPALLSPGEVGVQPDGSMFQVPGARVAADNVPMMLRPDTAILTDDGQNRMAWGASLQEAIDNQVPHFRKGGVAGSAINTAAIAARTAGFRGRTLVNMVAIAGRETGGTYDPKTTNFKYPDHSIGPWQINQLAHKGRYGTDRQLMNILTNAKAAYSLFGKVGYQPWVGVNYGNASSYLDDARRAVLATKGKGIKGSSYTKTTQPKVTHPLLGNILAPLTDDPLMGGIEAGYAGTSRRHLLTEILEGIRPQAEDRPTREKVTVAGAKGVGGGRGGFKAGGGWAGTQALVMRAIRGVGGSKTYKRSRAINGNQNSDHNTWIKNAFATDISPGSDGIFSTIARRIGIAARKGSWNIFNNKPISGFRSQLLWYAPDGSHRDHVHLGIRKMRRGGWVGMRKGGMPGKRKVGVWERDTPGARLRGTLRLLGGSPGTESADSLTRQLSRQVRGRSMTQLLRGEKLIERRLRAMTKKKSPGGKGLTGSERITARRLQGGLSLLQDQMGRPIGRELAATDRVQEQTERRESRINDELIVRGIDPESDEGIAARIALDQQSKGALEGRRAKLQKQLKRAKKTGNKAAVKRVQGELNEVDDQILGLDSSIVQLTKAMQDNTDAQNALAEAQAALAEATNRQAEEAKALREAIEKQIQFADGVAAITSAEAVRAMSDVITGGLGAIYETRARTAGDGAVARI